MKEHLEVDVEISSDLKKIDRESDAETMNFYFQVTPRKIKIRSFSFTSKLANVLPNPPF